MLSFIEMLQVAIDNNASDVFIVAGQPLSYKKEKSIHVMEDEKVMPSASRALVEEAYKLDEVNMRDAVKNLKNIYYILGDEENLKRVEMM